jgi:AcrR family transcriptional regulator
MYGQLIELFYAPGIDPALATRRFFEGAADTVRDSDYADACPIATVALEVASTSEPLRKASAEVFESWLAAIDAHLVAAGLTKAQARKLSVSLFCLLEGAFMLARAGRDHTVVRSAGRTAADLVRAAIESRAAPARGNRGRDR